MEDVGIRIALREGEVNLPDVGGALSSTPFCLGKDDDAAPATHHNVGL